MYLSTPTHFAPVNPLAEHDLRNLRLLGTMIMICLIATLMSPEVLAQTRTAADGGTANGGGGAFIKGLYNFIGDALQGYVGGVIGMAGVLVGLVGGIVKGSLLGLGTGTGLAIGGFYGPGIVDSLRGFSYSPALLEKLHSIPTLTL